MFYQSSLNSEGVAEAAEDAAITIEEGAVAEVDLKITEDVVEEAEEEWEEAEDTTIEEGVVIDSEVEVNNRDALIAEMVAIFHENVHKIHNEMAITTNKIQEMIIIEEMADITMEVVAEEEVVDLLEIPHSKESRKQL